MYLYLANMTAWSNFALAVATFAATMVSLYIAVRSTKTKIKVIFKYNKIFLNDTYHIRFTNVGIAPVNVLKKGFIVYEFLWQKKTQKILTIQEVNKKIEQSENVVLAGKEKEINELLIERKFQPGEEVKLIGLISDSKGKKYYKKFTHSVRDQSEFDLKLTLKDEHNS